MGAKRKPRVAPIRAPLSQSEAWDMAMLSLSYFLKHHTLKTGAVIVLACGSLLMGWVNYLTTNKVSLKEAVPVDAAPVGMKFELMPQAYAGGQPITINGKVYGYLDASFEVWKLAGENTFLVHNKKSGAIFKLEDLPLK